MGCDCKGVVKGDSNQVRGFKVYKSRWTTFITEHESSVEHGSRNGHRKSPPHIYIAQALLRILRKQIVLQDKGTDLSRENGLLLAGDVLKQA